LSGFFVFARVGKGRLPFMNPLYTKTENPITTTTNASGNVVIVHKTTVTYNLPLIICVAIGLLVVTFYLLRAFVGRREEAANDGN
jgi:hypothetical protein